MTSELAPHESRPFPRCTRYEIPATTTTAAAGGGGAAAAAAAVAAEPGRAEWCRSAPRNGKGTPYWPQCPATATRQQTGVRVPAMRTASHHVLSLPSCWP
ncbi:hypothetical protein VTK26DRAFT_5682 [Humicola hyalothermophila]